MEFIYYSIFSYFLINVFSSYLVDYLKYSFLNRFSLLKHFLFSIIFPSQILCALTFYLICSSHTHFHKGMTYKEIETTMEEEFHARQKDKLRYRYPRGESYEDLIRRVEPVIMELERSTRPVLIIGHQAVLRCLLAYLCETVLEELPHADVPIHTIMKVTPHAYGTRIEKFPIL
jgi:bisphosphoglycerate-dependent phosphoglycerate mutase